MIEGLGEPTTQKSHLQGPLSGHVVNLLFDPMAWLFATFGQKAGPLLADPPPFQRSICSDISKASSTSIPRYLTVLSSFP